MNPKDLPRTLWIATRCLPVLLASLLASCGCALKPCARNIPFHLSSFTVLPAEQTGGDYPVYMTAKGSQIVVVLHEISGLSAGALNLAEDLHERKCQVYLPLLFGKPAQANLKGSCQVLGNNDWQLIYPDKAPVIQKIVRCVQTLASRHPGKSITVIGNCLTAMIALETFAQCDAVKQVVVCQPAIPFLKPGKSLGVPAHTIKTVREKLANHPGCKVIGVHFTEDPKAFFSRSLTLNEKLAPTCHPGQLYLLFGAEKGDSCPVAMTPGRILVPVQNEAGHSTVTGSEREAFREALYPLILKH